MAVQALKPRVDLIKERFGDDKDKVQKETSVLYEQVRTAAATRHPCCWRLGWYPAGEVIACRPCAVFSAGAMEKTGPRGAGARPALLASIRRALPGCSHRTS